MSTAYDARKAIQQILGVTTDGLIRAGGETEQAFHRVAGLPPDALWPPAEAQVPAVHPMAINGPWPLDNDTSLREFYGAPGENHLVTIALPYPMRLAWETSSVVTRSRCHLKVRDSLRHILERVLEFYGSLEEVRAHRMDLFGGIYNFRNIRGGASLSRHSWGIAIDLDPDQNGNQTPWPAKATMPKEVIAIFREHGWKSAGVSWGRDAMHFQATK